MLTTASASLLVALLVLAGLSWAYLATPGGAVAMSGEADPAGFVLFLTTWVVMMGAMMFPAVAPVVLVYTQYTRRQTTSWTVHAALFLTGYVVIWTAVGMVAWMIVALLEPPLTAIPIVQAAPQLFLGAALVAAGLYQLTPLKKACLGHCRSPMRWIFLGFRPGKSGALRMGLEEGVFCLGCCAGLMVMLLAVGLASVGWMAAVAAIIFVEKVLAPTAGVAKLVGLGLLAFGIAVATIPALAEFTLSGRSM